MVSFPHAKINLGLNIIRKRPDGYHDLETCFYPIPWTDILEVIPATSFSFTSSGLPVEGNAESNLCVKAYHLLAKEFTLPPIAIHLHKVIPMGAGLGGGSSDGAFTLRQLNTVFQLGLSETSLVDYAAQLGSDCAFFITDLPMIGSGRGEVLTPIALSLKNKFMVVVKPNIHVSTAEAFAGIKPEKNEIPVREIVQKPVEEWKELLRNDFENSIFQRHPYIRAIKDTMYAHGALYSSMSGSGSSVFAIFNHETDLRQHFSECSYWSNRLP